MTSKQKCTADKYCRGNENQRSATVVIIHVAGAVVVGHGSCREDVQKYVQAEGRKRHDNHARDYGK